MAKDDDPGKVWARALVERVGKAVKEARKGKSAVWLSDRTAELGYRISPTVIAKLDSGHRGDVLSVPELLVLAAALNTSPVNLVYPGPYQNKVEILPGSESEEIVAVQWFSGITRYTPEKSQQWDDSTETLRAYRRLVDLVMSRSMAYKRSVLDDDPAIIKIMNEQITFYDNEIHELEQQLGLGDDDA